MSESEKNHKDPLNRETLKGKKILIVDDTLDNQILERMYLVSAGAKVDLAANGEEGVKKARNDNYDAILMDLHMPEVDGFKATEQLRKEGFVKPIIAVTANCLPETKETAMTNGFNEFLTKPLSRKTLLETIDQIFNQCELDAIRKSLRQITDQRKMNH